MTKYKIFTRVHTLFVGKNRLELASSDTPHSGGFYNELESGGIYNEFVSGGLYNELESGGIYNELESMTS